MVQKTLLPKISKKTIKAPKSSLVLAVLLFLIFLFLPGQNIYETGFIKKKPPVANLPQSLPTPAPYPVNISGILPPDLTAQAVLVMDIPSQVVLYQKNPKSRLSPASITKLMTALVALEQYKMEDILTVKTPIFEGRTMGLVPGERLTFENLLYGTLVHSANDAAYVLAENYSGGVEKFVQRMNEKASELFLTETNFANPVGFEENGHYTTAQDLARLATHALQNPIIAKTVGTPAITVADVSFTRFYQLENVNQLLGKIPGVLGVKTGFTQNAGECLVTAVTKNGKKILIVILSSKDRFGETQALIDWAFSNFIWESPVLPKQD
ncbi:D-alanyl-D-alanine carboxypeptidase [Candidatus Gottesmanbacteria bacterium]|nr:D-alanyl-D-alanine carboxypeptidase [Candidatus Gottesmanbacteria bacterium]MBI5465350.1 D-alanyl-D-alanine carboxypeptidase [Candidatus Gottesmanbacteria bacterium]